MSGEFALDCSVGLELAGQPLLELAREVVARLQGAGHEAYFVGGSVRNLLLGLPAHDVDIATSAHPDQVGALFERTRLVGAHFGVALVGFGGEDFEVATFRAEGCYVDRRHPSMVRYGTLAEDFERRDFTINAMYYDPVARGLIDPAGGRADLQRRLLRTVGDPRRRFDEDALRLLRAVRFAVRYGLTIETRTAEAIALLAHTLPCISVERIADELMRMLRGPRPGRAMRLLGELGLWPFIIPEVEAMRGCTQPENFHPEGDVFEHTVLVLDALHKAWPGGAPPAPLALAALLHDVGKPPTRTVSDRIRFNEHQRVGAQMTLEIGRRLRLPNATALLAADMVEQHMRFMDVGRMRRSRLRQFLGQPHFDQHMALHMADCLGSHGKLENYEYCQALLEEFAQAQASEVLLPDPLLSGKELIALGLRPGPVFKELLDAVREEQLEGRLTTRDEAIDWLRASRAELFAPCGGPEEKP